MSDLDKKLRFIISDAQGYIDDDSVQKEAQNIAIEQISQAFKDAGWAPRTEREVQVSPVVWPPKGLNTKLMTGKEWYDRFMELAPRQLTAADELDFNLHDDDPEGNCYYAWNCAVAGIDKAARRAAGMEE